MSCTFVCFEKPQLPTLKLSMDAGQNGVIVQQLVEEVQDLEQGSVSQA